MDIDLFSYHIELKIRIRRSGYTIKTRLRHYLKRKYIQLSSLWKWRLISREQNYEWDEKSQMHPFKDYAKKWMKFDDAIEEAVNLYWGYPLGVESGLGVFIEWELVEKYCSRRNFY